MRIVVDTDTGMLQVTGNGVTTTYSQFSPEAFRILSRLWLVMGWNLGHWSSFSWMGRQLLQFPDDVLHLAELLWAVRPDVILETGVYDGGSTLFFASCCRLSGTGRVISIERDFRPGVIEAVQQAAGDLATLIEGDSASPETLREVRRHIRPADRVCVFLDADHSAQHVAAELRNFGPLVPEGCYLIVADSICADLAHTPQGERHWAGDHPGVAVDEFLAGHPEFTRHRPAPLFPSAADFTGLSYFPTTWLLRR